LLYFGLLFVGFIVFSPTGLVGVWKRVTEPFRRKVVEAAAMNARAIEQGVPLPEFLKHAPHEGGGVLEARGLAKAFGGIRAVTAASFVVSDRTLHALIGPNGAGKTTGVQSGHRHVPTRRGFGRPCGQSIAGLPPYRIAAAGLGRSFQITNLFPRVSIEENLRLAVQARDASHFDGWADAQRNERVTSRTAELVRYLGLSGIEQAEAGSLSYGGQRLLDMGLALAGAPRVLLLDEPLAGLAARERERVGDLIKRISADVPVLLVEHDIDRVFALADRVTVMNEGKVLVDGTADDARQSQAVREVYIGSGTAALAARPRGHAARAAGPLVLDLDSCRCVYGKSHIVMEASLKVHEHEIVALLGRNGAGKSTLLKTIIGIVTAQSGRILLSGVDLARRPAAANARSGIGYVPQGRGLFAGMSVRHNLELGSLKRRRGQGVAWSDEKILEFFPRLRARLDTPADFLSGGEQQWSPSRGHFRDTCACCCSTSLSKASPPRWSRSCSRPSTVCDRNCRSSSWSTTSTWSSRWRTRRTCSSAAAWSTRDRRLRCATTSICAGASSGCEPMERIAAIIGGGLIGRAWAMVFARAGWRVRLYDNAPAQLELARSHISASLDEQQAAGLVDDAKASGRSRRDDGAHRGRVGGCGLGAGEPARGARHQTERLSHAGCACAAQCGGGEFNVRDPGIAVHGGARRTRALSGCASGQSAAPRSCGRIMWRAVDQPGDHRTSATGNDRRGARCLSLCAVSWTASS
jgi:ABC-type branched-subunit amino acid transport system ATPase component